jgi:cyclopropane-fatty-acyl-phospholipid synthase
MASSKLRAHFERLAESADIRIDGDRPWDIRVHDERLFQRVLSHGTLGLGEGYMDGWWDCDQLDELVRRAQTSDLPRKLLSPTTVLRVAQAKVMNLQSSRRAFQIGERHYDIGNDLYRRMLDGRMIYSCGYWRDADTLDAAQEAKLILIANKLGLEPGMRVLDIGCGWGGAAQFFAEKFGCEMVGITVSREQASLARERCAGLPVEIRLQDYRELDEPFDRVYSIGMFEHVGVKNYKTYMDVVRRCLRDAESLSLLHTIGALRTRHQTDPWIERYIFPNSMLPSIPAALHTADLTRRRRTARDRRPAQLRRLLRPDADGLEEQRRRPLGRALRPVRRPLQAHVGLVPALIGREFPRPQAPALAVRHVARRHPRRLPRRAHPLTPAGQALRHTGQRRTKRSFCVHVGDPRRS